MTLRRERPAHHWPDDVMTCEELHEATQTVEQWMRSLPIDRVATTWAPAWADEVRRHWWAAVSQRPLLRDLPSALLNAWATDAVAVAAAYRQVCVGLDEQMRRTFRWLDQLSIRRVDFLATLRAYDRVDLNVRYAALLGNDWDPCADDELPGPALPGAQEPAPADSARAGVACSPPPHAADHTDRDTTTDDEGAL